MSRDSSSSPAPDRDGAFATTEWSLVLAAGGDTAARQAALERLCRTYWRPVYAFIRHLGHDAESAKDLTQSLFAHLLAGDFFATADPARGRFRAYLRQTARLFLGNEWQKSSARKRGGGVQWVPWEALTPADETQFARATDPSADYDRQWALALLRGAMSRLRAEYETAGDAHVFTLLQPYLAARPSPGDYDRLAAGLGVARGSVPVLVHRLGKRYQELIRAEVASTVATRAEVDAELRHCLAALEG
ncbi:MAG: sigma-70 family RNA polymerase sigma factor [Verrucomicrobia bacterium]|nr:sigma-70 family RNA polymerase sigma factor [Verrucomicrobiota bacterium]